ncbi:MAG: PorV/PorQ family protein, partial [Elusimicrobia bacterium]|nr:PorV/PorQ family protein [Elusimicrobiota bacterium]
LTRPLSARAAAMGGAYAAVQDAGAESPQYNPAALARLRRPALAASYLDGFGGVTHGFLSVEHPLPVGAAAAGLLYFNAGSIDLNLSDGTRGTVTAEEDLAATFSYALPLPWGLSAGATYRFLRMTLAQTAHAVSHQADLGLQWKTPLPGLSFGGAYQYWGKDIRFEEAGDPPPKTWRLGAALRFPDLDVSKLDPATDLDAFDMTLSADLVQTLYESASPRLGMEMGLTPAMLSRVALRAGWVFNTFGEGLCFGAGLRHGSFAFDYGYGAVKEMVGMQNVTLSYTF